MRGDELAVEQFGPAPPQRRDQPGQRHFRRIARAAEHALAAESPVEADAIEAADKVSRAVLVGLPAFDRVRLAQFMQPLIAGGDAPADPAFAVFAPARCGAGLHHRGEGGVAGDGEAAPPQSARQRAREVEAVQWQDRPAPWLHPEDLGVLAVVGHREDAAAIGKHQQVGVDDRRLGRRVHPAALAGRARPGEGGWAGGFPGKRITRSLFARRACQCVHHRLEAAPPAGV